MTSKVDYTYITQLKLQKKTKLKKVVLHCTTLTFWRCVAD